MQVEACATVRSIEPSSSEESENALVCPGRQNPWAMAQGFQTLSLEHQF